MINRMILNERSYFGRGARKEVITELKDHDLKRPLVVTDKALMDEKITAMIIELLEKAQIPYSIYYDIKPNPTVANVKKGLLACKTISADCVIAVGGGSVIDTAKAIAIIMTNPEHSDVLSLDGLAVTNKRALPIIAIPTTSGTAAEVTINYVITDENHAKKMVCIDPHDIPIAAIIDPDLMEKMPPSLAAATGMDALTHAMEGYLTKAAWTMTDMFHINAMALIYKNLELAVNKKDKNAIDQIGLAQYIAGMGFSNVGLGIVHSMAHALGALYDTPHGVANAILLPYVLEFNGEVCPILFRNMADAFGLETASLTDQEVVQKVVEAVKILSRKVGIPRSLQEIGVDDRDLQILAKKAIQDVCTAGNIRNVEEHDILELYKKAYM